MPGGGSRWSCAEVGRKLGTGPGTFVARVRSEKLGEGMIEQEEEEQEEQQEEEEEQEEKEEQEKQEDQEEREKEE